MFDQIKNWHLSLPARDRTMLHFMVAIVSITLFYLMLWEPTHKGLADEELKLDSQQGTLSWMQQAAAEARALKSSGGSHPIKQANQPITLVLEQSINNAGLKKFIKKIESSGSSGARIQLDKVSFNQMLVWLNTINTHNGISVSSASIERGDKPGTVNAKLSFTR